MTVYEQPFERALRWLLHSGIQESNGGVARYYRSDRQQNRPISTEITGYQASTLAWFCEKLGKTAALEGAVKTADFLVNQAWNHSLKSFAFEYPDPAPSYFFDSGIIVRGLLSVWRITKSQRYWDVAEQCAGQMVADFDSGFDFHPIVSLPAKTAAIRDPRWSQSSGCYQLKAAVCWHEIAQITANPILHAAWLRLLEQSLDHHSDFLPGHSDEERVMDRLHAYCYFLEALLCAGPGARESHAIALGTQRVTHLLHRIAPSFVRSDVYAQLLRIRIYADALNILPLDTHTAALEAEQLASFQLKSEDPREDGGFCFGKKEGGLLPFANPVSTDFAVQALHLWHLRQTGAALPPASGLV